MQFWRTGLDLCSGSFPGLFFVPWLQRISTCSCTLKAMSLSVDFVSNVCSRALLFLLLDCNISFDNNEYPWKALYFSYTRRAEVFPGSGKDSSRSWVNVKINCILCVRVSSLGLREEYSSVWFSIFFNQ